MKKSKVYSQHEIEKYLDRHFKLPGNFLEIGAWDGELISQTAWLERERGWSGVCVDPFPRNFEGRSCRVVPMAISGNGKPRDFIKVTKDRRHGGDVSYFSGFFDSISIHWPVIRDHCDYELIQVPTVTFADLCTRFDLGPHIDFLSIDVEGSELEIFESIDYSAFTFGMIVFEHNDDRNAREGVGTILTKNGYVLLDALRCDDIYTARRIEE